MKAKANVVYFPPPSNWHEMGGTEEAANYMPNIDWGYKHSYWYRMRITEEQARFEQAIGVNEEDKVC